MPRPRRYRSARVPPIGCASRQHAKACASRFAASASRASRRRESRPRRAGGSVRFPKPAPARAGRQSARVPRLASRLAWRGCAAASARSCHARPLHGATSPAFRGEARARRAHARHRGGDVPSRLPEVRPLRSGHPSAAAAPNGSASRRGSAICLTASNPMAPSRIASVTAAATISIGMASISRRTWMNANQPFGDWNREKSPRVQP